MALWDLVRYSHGMRPACTLALLFFATPAAADPLLWAEGTWGFEPAFVQGAETPEQHEERKTLLCGGSAALRVSIDKDARRYRSASGDFVIEGDISQVTPHSFAIAYDGEERLMDNGEPHIWHWVFADRDNFFWVRDDWRAKGGRTNMLVRCNDTIA